MGNGEWVRVRIVLPERWYRVLYRVFRYLDKIIGGFSWGSLLRSAFNNYKLLLQKFSFSGNEHGLIDI